MANWRIFEAMQVSRHMVVCRAAKDAGALHHEYIKTQFSRMHSSMTLSEKHAIFAL